MAHERRKLCARSQSATEAKKIAHAIGRENTLKSLGLLPSLTKHEFTEIGGASRTCKKLGQDPRSYIRDTLKRILDGEKDLNALLPENYKPGDLLGSALESAAA